MADHVEMQGVTVCFAPEAKFDADAIKRAAYRFTDKISVEISETPSGWVCRLRALEDKGISDLNRVAGEFRNEVLDQDLRIKISAETAQHRNLILALAFSKTSLGQ